MIIQPGEEWYAGGETQRISPRSSADVLAEAQENIEKYRKGNAELVFTDEEGGPLKNVEIAIEQTQQEFTFGAPLYEPHAVYRDGHTESTKFANYTHYFKSIFNMATALCYWNERSDPWTEKYQGDLRIKPFLYSVDWAKANGLTVKGHPLVWSVPKAVPDWLLRYDYETQLKFLEVRVRSLIAAAGDKVEMWDLVNEALWEPSWRHIPNRVWPHLETTKEILTYIEPAMRWAKSENPNGKYVINEYGMEYDLGGSAKNKAPASLQRKRMVELIKEMQKRGIAPDAVGVQAHTGGSWYHPADVKTILDELATTGVDLQITEFWASPNDLPDKDKMTKQAIEEARAKYAKEFYTVAFSHPQMTSIAYWGFGGMFASFDGSSEMRPLPIYNELRKLIREEWMTFRRERTDSEGRLHFRGFHGEYKLRYRSKDGRVRTLPLTIRSNRETRENIILRDAR